jgi:preprotein translocase subunit SecG
VLFAIWDWIPVVWDRLILLLGIFLILLVLIQRGKGGGLAGAFGGVGGSSPFGSRAGDTFTRITIGVATVWILMIVLAVKMVQWSKGDQVNAAVMGTSNPGQTK